jgi:tellurite resistance protein TehA-like permease
MTIDPSEAAASLRHIATIEQRTREAVFYAGSSAIFIMWGLVVACGYGLAEFYPRSANTTWLVVLAVGCAATALIIAVRTRTRPHEAHRWRIVWAMVALTAYGAAWSYVLGPIVPRPVLYAFQPSLFLLGMILAGLWLGRVFIVLGLVGIALMLVGYLQAEPWLRVWMAVVQSGTLILGGVWLHRNGVPR